MITPKKTQEIIVSDQQIKKGRGDPTPEQQNSGDLVGAISDVMKHHI